jgi:hypothetical protein
MRLIKTRDAQGFKLQRLHCFTGCIVASGRVGRATNDRPSSFPACRLVIPPGAVLNLVDQPNDLLDTLEREGVLKREQAHAPPSKVQ